MTTRATRAWDSYDAYLFDIDGTLLHCTDAVHYFAFCDTLTALAARPMNLDGVVAHGNVDRGILRDAMLRTGLAEAAWRPQMDAACDALSQQVERNRADLRADVMPRIVEALEHLRGRGAKLGVATGNLGRIGRLKLQHCELLQRFDFFGWSDGLERRADVFAHALSLARAAAGGDAAVCVVGDTPADVEAAQANALDCIAVATGVYTAQQLAAAQPTRCIATFADLLGAGGQAAHA